MLSLTDLCGPNGCSFCPFCPWQSAPFNLLIGNFHKNSWFVCSFCLPIRDNCTLAGATQGCPPSLGPFPMSLHHYSHIKECIRTHIFAPIHILLIQEEMPGVASAHIPSFTPTLPYLTHTPFPLVRNRLFWFHSLPSSPPFHPPPPSPSLSLFFPP